MPVVLALIAAYIVGSVDFAVIVGRMNGVDIHQEGSGNPGTSNVLRVLGKGAAAAVLIGDAFKGVIGAAMGAVAGGMVGASTTGTGISHWAFATGLAAVVGHCYPMFHRFKGGKGVATGFGVMIFTVWQVALISIVVWAILAKFTKVASISSLIAILVAIPVAIWQGVEGLSLLWMALTIALIIWRHRSNIGRMVKRDEQTVPT